MYTFFQFQGGTIQNGWASIPWVGNPFQSFDRIISTIIAILTIIAGVYFIFLVITGGLALISSADNKNALEEARKKITTGLIGLVVVISALFLADLIGRLFGIDILNPGELFSQLGP